MTPILLPMASVVAITGAVWLARALFAVRLCPICIGVGGTWLWMVLAREFGYPVDATVLALLLGGSVAGLASLLEKRVPAARSALLWKTLFIPTGLVAAYGLLAQQWVVFGTLFLALAALTAFFLSTPAVSSGTGRNVEDLARRMRDCC
jgi:hypothetical protein